MWVNYEIITVLDKKQHEIRIALLVIKVIRKDCYHINENWNIMEEERKDIVEIIEAIKKTFYIKDKSHL